VTGTPGLSSLAETVSEVGVRSLLLSGCVAVGLYLVRAAGRSPEERTLGGDSGPAERFEALLDAPPERVTATRDELTAGALDAQIDGAVAGDDHALAAVRERLADVAAAALTRHTDHTAASAEEAVAAGTWTDDPVAAAFLAGPAGPVFALPARTRRWLDPETERRRRIDRTVRAVEAVAGAGARSATASAAPNAGGQPGTVERGTPAADPNATDPNVTGPNTANSNAPPPGREPATGPATDAGRQAANGPPPEQARPEPPRQDGGEPHPRDGGVPPSREDGRARRDRGGDEQ
jgi:hypothetical protein